MTLTILNNGLTIDDSLRFAWFQLAEGNRQYYRAVAMMQLAVMPVSSRDDYDLMGKQKSAVRGLHNAGVNFLYAAVGMFNPEHIGIVQYYGAAADGNTREEAERLAGLGMSAVLAQMANFNQSKLAAPRPEWFQWYLDFLTTRAKNISVLLGHPDPRKGERGVGQDGRPAGTNSNDDLAAEQNELLFRGLAKTRQDFVYQVMAQHVPRIVAQDYVMRVAEIGSIVGSRRRGSVGFGMSFGIPLMAAVGRSIGAGQSAGESRGISSSESVGESWGTSHQHGVSSSSSVSVGHSVSSQINHSTSQVESNSVSQAHTESSSVGASQAEMAGGSHSTNLGWNVGVSLVPVGLGVSGGASGGSADSQSWGVTDTVSQSQGVADTHGSTQGWANGVSQGVSQGVTDTITRTSSSGTSEAWGSSHQTSRGHAEGISSGEQSGRTLSEGVNTGMSSGVVPGLSFSRSWQTEDHVADALTQVIGMLEEHCKSAAAEGGFMTNALLFTDTHEGQIAGEALIPQAFHGPDVPTPVLTVRPDEKDVEPLRTHAMSFKPWEGPLEGDPFGGILWTSYATLNHCGGVAALTAPGLFEEGAASTVQAPIPAGMAFYPQMPGEMILGHQYSPETADLTTAQVRLDFAGMMHCGFFGDTGYGKSVGAIRLVYERALRCHTREVVLDFGAGWRQILNAPGLDGHVNILQLQPDGVRPFRWNPLQIGRHINPETQWRAFADVFTAIAQMGVKRQKQELLDALRTLYLVSGAMVDDPEVRASAWGTIQIDETDLVGKTEGTPIGDLTIKQRQNLAVHRSQGIGLPQLYEVIQKKLNKVPARDTMLTGVLEGILMRMNPLVQGSAARQFAPGLDCVPLEDLSRPWGITIIEGGPFLDEFSKAFLLAWTGWHLHTDMVSRRVHEVRDEPMLGITYEEANKIFGVKSTGGGDEGGTGLDIASYFEAFLRDARKYKVFYIIIGQNPSVLPVGIVASCSNIVIVSLKNAKDKDTVLSALARSERGFHDEEWRRFLNDMPIGMAVGRFPYTLKREMQRAFLFRPLMLEVPEPVDAEIGEKLGVVSL